MGEDAAAVVFFVPELELPEELALAGAGVGLLLAVVLELDEGVPLGVEEEPDVDPEDEPLDVLDFVPEDDALEPLDDVPEEVVEAGVP